ncbi:hypothetical protein IMCC3317_41260 [Kordia antarctica]|uniref:DUF1800 domain-containing protein n=1 Tax=Kordia antarctica TaxID=1218801 RepID=A0A7L4ZQ32_9FLAO|nr:DUF1800 domain-containing protein [Kordia antarctica]QHI38732.1 hypothetical protein IMCC3317_41260 [Kordia antarctica]
MTLQEIVHIYYRVGFGISYAEATILQKESKETIVNELFNASREVKPLAIDISELTAKVKNLNMKDRKKLRSLIKDSTKKVHELNIAWIYKLGNTEQLLREKMTLFWANHFVCQDNNILHIQHYNNTLRKHALGNFKDFVIAISKEASMIKYLNTKQNKKAKPNENFARELMELFTLGRDNYSEKDIKESARAFTGWNHDFMGNFRLRRFQHDTEEKTFFGETGNFDGEDIIDIILKQKQCAKYICEKIYRYFVNDTIDDSRVSEMTTIFFKDYDIENLMRFVLLSDWFYDEKNIGTKIKSPIEFLVGVHRIVPMQFEKPRELIYLQKLLGQHLLFPPNVAGWKGGRNWINPNTMMLRLNLPSVLLANGPISLDEKGEFEDDFQRFNNKRNKQRKLKVLPDWETFHSQQKDVTLKQLQQTIIVSPLNSGTAAYLEKLETQDLKKYSIQLMSLPEYQLC